MLHLARKAFFPGKPPFPLLHIDTGWKFREMIAFRDETARRLGLDLIVHTNEEGRARGIDPIASGSALHTAVMKTEALKQALDRHGFDAALGGARRDEEKSRAKERMFSRAQRRPCAGTRRTRGPNSGGSTTPVCASGNRCACSRCPTGPSWTSGNTSQPNKFPVVPLYFAKSRPVVSRGGVWIMVDDDRLPLRARRGAANCGASASAPWDAIR